MHIHWSNITENTRDFACTQKHIRFEITEPWPDGVQ
jgi:hypothetical protein